MRKMAAFSGPSDRKDSPYLSLASQRAGGEESAESDRIRGSCPFGRRTLRTPWQWRVEEISERSPKARRQAWHMLSCQMVLQYAGTERRFLDFAEPRARFVRFEAFLDQKTPGGSAPCLAHNAQSCLNMRCSCIGAAPASQVPPRSAESPGLFGP